MYYTGIGSRETPPEWRQWMCNIAFYLAPRGWTLRSGGADGADAAFEEGCDAINGAKEIYLPWKGFNRNPSPRYAHIFGEEAERIASIYHPAWHRLSMGARKLHARNVFQVRGETLDEPSKFVLCWTKNGADVGGTRTAIVLARSYGIPVFNMGAADGWEKFRNFCIASGI